MENLNKETTTTTTPTTTTTTPTTTTTTPTTTTTTPTTTTTTPTTTTPTVEMARSFVETILAKVAENEKKPVPDKDSEKIVFFQGMLKDYIKKCNPKLVTLYNQHFVVYSNLVSDDIIDELKAFKAFYVNSGLVDFSHILLIPEYATEKNVKIVNLLKQEKFKKIYDDISLTEKKVRNAGTKKAGCKTVPTDLSLLASNQLLVEEVSDKRVRLWKKDSSSFVVRNTAKIFSDLFKKVGQKVEYKGYTTDKYNQSFDLELA